MLTNPLYAELIKCKWFPDLIEAIHKPIITRDTFFRVQQILTGKKPSIVPRARNHPDFPLRRFLRCLKCDTRLTAGWSTGRKKIKYGYYHCRTKGCSFNVQKAVLENAFFEYLKTFEPRENIIDLFNATVINAYQTKQSEEIKEDTPPKPSFLDNTIPNRNNKEYLNLMSRQVRNVRFLRLKLSLWHINKVEYFQFAF